MSDEIKNFDDFKEKTKQERMLELKRRMDSLREELKELRDSHSQQDGLYAKIQDDDEYRVLLNEGDFTKNDIELKINRLYPSLEDMEAMRPKTKERRDYTSEKQKLQANTVYIKEFHEDPEVVKAQIESMKKGAPTAPILPELTKELPISKRDVEKYIGENLVAKLASLTILVTIIVAYRYAISMGYIPPFVRIIVGSVIGIAFFAIAHYLLKKKTPVTTTLVLLGAMTFYYTAYLAQYDYGMISQVMAFIVNLLITISVTAAAVVYNRMRLAIIAVLGGYATPFVVGQGNDNYIFFFSYVFVVNLTMMVIAYLKDWRPVNLVAFIATFLFLIGWIAFEEETGRSEYLWLLIFSSLFYFVFYVNDIVYNIKAHITFITLDFYLMLAYTALYVGGVYFVLNGLGELQHLDWFCAGLGAFNMLYAALVYRRDNVDDELEELLLWKGIVFTLLCGYLLFPEVYVHNYWAVVSIIFLWIGLKLDDRWLKNAAAVSLALTIISMCYTWFDAYYEHTDEMSFVLNRGFWAGCITSLTVGLNILLLHEKKEEFNIVIIPRESYVQILGSVLILISFLSGLFELLFHTKNTIGGVDFRILALGAYNMVFILGVRFVVMGYDIDRLKLFTGTMMGLAVISYLFYGHFSTIALRDEFLSDQKPFFLFGFHYLNVGLSVLLVYLLIKDIVKSEGYASGKYSIVMWIMCVMFVTHATFELEHTIVLLRNGIFEVNLEAVLDQIRLTGYSILWTIIAFGFMYLGMRNKIKELRLISLVLLGLTLVKFFVFDFWSMLPLWQIFSSFVIGVLLLIVSNMYRQLKRLVTKGELVLDKDKTLSQDEAAEMIKMLGRRKKDK